MLRMIDHHNILQKCELWHLLMIYAKMSKCQTLHLRPYDPQVSMYSWARVTELLM